MSDIRNRLTPQQAQQSVQKEQDFQRLLSRARQSQTVDVAAAMRRYAASQPMTAKVSSASSRQSSSMYVARAGDGTRASAIWTGFVDTSDGMLEKAAPYMDIIQDASSVYGVPVNVIMAVIKAESDYQIDCVSYSGAMGLMQIMPENAEYYGITDAYDPRQNIMCGTEEIARHLKSYNGDLRLALAAYNTGPGNVARRGVTSSSSAEYASIPLSVRQYADRVMRYAGLSS